MAAPSRALAVLLLALGAGPLAAEDPPAAPAATGAAEVITSHGISAFGDLKYPKLSLIHI